MERKRKHTLLFTTAIVCVCVLTFTIKQAKVCVCLRLLNIFAVVNIVALFKCVCLWEGVTCLISKTYVACFSCYCIFLLSFIYLFMFTFIKFPFSCLLLCPADIEFFPYSICTYNDMAFSFTAADFVCCCCTLFPYCRLCTYTLT